MSIVRVHWVLRVFGCVRLYGGACGDLLWVWGVGFGYVGISLAILLQFWGIDPKMSIVGSCGLGWSEKVKVAIVKNFRQFLNHGVPTFFICEIGLTFLQLNTIERLLLLFSLHPNIYVYMYMYRIFTAIICIYTPPTVIQPS